MSELSNASADAVILKLDYASLNFE